MRIFNSIFSFLFATLLSVTTAAVLNSTQIHILPFLAQSNASSEYDYTLLREVPDDTAIDGSGLNALSGRSNRKTVLLQDGEASDTISFSLILKPGETLGKIVHVVNDSTIITGRRRRVQQISPASYNITLAHEFEGDVGVAKFILQISTSRTRYITMGTYYAAGVSFRIPDIEAQKGIVSGIGSPGLTFQNPEVASLNSTVGQLPLYIDYQPVGPDVINVPPTLQDVLRTAQISVQNSDGESIPLFDFTSSECRSFQRVEKDENGRFVFEDGKCDIGYNESSNLLVLNLNREGYGSSVVTLALPTIIVDGESQETSINVYVGKPDSVKPVVVIDNGVELVLDHFGSEEFKLLMYNTVSPAQESNASVYVMDLPGKRYASVDFEQSQMLNPIQEVSFKTLRPGKEDPAIWSSIQKALGLEPESSPEMDMDMQPTPEFSVPNRNLKDIVRGLNMSSEAILKSDKTYNSNGVYAYILPGGENSIIGIDAMRDTNNMSRYQSTVFVRFPKDENLTSAVSSGDGHIHTSFASDQLAIIRSVGSEDPEVVQINVGLAGYSLANFSEHKNQQISEFLKEDALEAAKGTTGDGKLVRLKATNMGLMADYDVNVSGNSTEIAEALSKDETLPMRLADETYMDSSQLTDFSARAGKSRSLPDNVNGEQKIPSVVGVSQTAFAVAMVALALIIAIPLFALCFGYFVTRAHRSDESSDMSFADTTEAPIDGNLAVAVRADTPPSQGIFKDDFGRADDEMKGSFKMQKELFKDGYFGDNNPGTSQKQ